MSAVLKSLEKPQHHECGSNTANKKECFEYHKKIKIYIIISISNYLGFILGFVIFAVVWQKQVSKQTSSH